MNEEKLDEIRASYNEKTDAKIKIDPNLFKGAYAATAIKPTTTEINYVMKHSDEIIIFKNRHPYKTRTFSLSPENHGLECSCLAEDPNTDTDVTGFAFELDQSMTDVPKEDWDDEYSRQLTVLICEECAEWCLCD